MSPLPRGTHMVLLRALDFPVAMVSAVLPWQLQGIDVWSPERQAERANMWDLLYAHLRIAVPTYVALFYIPTVIAPMVRRRKDRGIRNELRDQ
jgi:hypothetical protein